MSGQLVLKGNVTNAKYKEAPERAYRHNPYVEALPQIQEWHEITDKIERLPAYEETDRDLPADIRLQLVQTIDNLILPSPVQIDLARRFSRMIRHGYMTRNPVKAEWKKQMRAAFKDLHWGSEDDGYEPLIRSSASGFSIIGASGVGKSTAIESVLGLFPQVIIHTEYNGQPFIQKQVVWLKLDCPKDGSLKSMLLNFFHSIDRAIADRDIGDQKPRNTFYRKFINYSVDMLLIEMGNVAHTLGLGLLVIDEIQRLSEAKSGGAQIMINTFVEMINTIGVPIVLVGTYKATKLLRKEFATARRSAGQGDLIWTHMSEDEEWDYMIKDLWEYQWTKVKTSWDEKLSATLYDECQGIIDFAVKLYKLVQWRAIGEGSEKITSSLIRQVAKDSLRLAKPMLDALRSGDENKLAMYSDLCIDIDSYLYEATERVTIYGSANTIRNQQKAARKPSENGQTSPYSQIIQWLVDAHIDVKIAKVAAKKAVELHAMDGNLQKAMHYAYQFADQALTQSDDVTTEQSSKKKKQNSILTNEEMAAIIDDGSGDLGNII